MTPGRATSPVSIRPASEEDLPTVRTLFLEYAKWLGVDLSFQGFEAELENLPGRYAPPDGSILIALDEERAAGCVALRRFDETRCEMKRLWVRESHRGSGIGSRLVQAVIQVARGNGYHLMVLDTLESMTSALTLYRSAGFSRISSYYDNPLPGAVYLGLDLLSK